uniref:Uncharacterized protein n=1 Tax=Anopheles farauti TaxID=69004 RepID=A0A182QDU2_9DIPT
MNPIAALPAQPVKRTRCVLILIIVIIVFAGRSPGPGLVHAWWSSFWNNNLASVPQPIVRDSSTHTRPTPPGAGDGFVAPPPVPPPPTHLTHVLRHAVQRGAAGPPCPPSARLRRCLRSRATRRWEKIWHTFRQPSEANSKKINIVPQPATVQRSRSQTTRTPGECLTANRPSNATLII